MNKRDYILRRVFFAFCTLVVIIISNFLLFRILPGDPVKMLIHSPRMTPEVQEQIKQDFGLDKPIWFNFEKLAAGDIGGVFDSQFFRYVVNLFKGDMGISFSNRLPVTEVLGQRIWRTVLLIFAGEVISLILGMLLGLYAAWKRGTKIDAGLLLFALCSWALPSFFLGIILLIMFKDYLPIGGMITPGLKVEDGLAYWMDLGKHLILPTITMAIVFTGEYIMIMRSSMIDILGENYILTAKAKGLTTFQILKDHALKNAMLPMVTVIALTLGFMVGGAIQIETVFSWPGIGRLMFDAVGARDFPVLQGAFLILAVSVILANLCADLLYSVLDPRVKSN